MTAAAGERLLLRLHSPQTAGFGVRDPPLLPHLISLKGERRRKSTAYKTVRAAALKDGALSLQVKKSK